MKIQETFRDGIRNFAIGQKDMVPRMRTPSETELPEKPVSETRTHKPL